jgi:hypothetical protein
MSEKATVTLRLQFDVNHGKRLGVERQVWEQPIEKLDPYDVTPLVLAKGTRFGEWRYHFSLDSNDGKVAVFHPKQVKPSSALLRDLPHWGYSRVS